MDRAVIIDSALFARILPGPRVDAVDSLHQRLLFLPLFSSLKLFEVDLSSWSILKGT